MQRISLVRAAATLAVLVACGCAARSGEASHNGAPAAASPAPAAAPSAAAADAAVTAPAAAGDDALSAEHLERDALIDAVLRHNPTLAAAHQAWESARRQPAAVGALDDPVLGYAFAPASIGSSRVDYGESVDLAQRLPWPGVLRLRGESASFAAAARGHDHATLRLELAAAAAQLFADYYLVDRALEINAHHVRLLEDFKRVATARYAAGLLGQQDPLQAEVELAHVEHERVILGSERRVTVARLNALLHRPPGADLPPPPVTLAVEEFVAHPSAANEELAARYEELALGQRPELAAAAAEIAERRAESGLADLAGYPGVDVMLSYNSMWADTEHRWMTGLRFNLPIWRGRIAAERAQARARVMEAEAMRRALEDEVRSAVRQAIERLFEARHVVELYRNRLLPAAADQVRAARAAVETGQGAFLALIMAEQNLRDVELGRERARADVDRRFAELARSVGRLPREVSELASASLSDSAAGSGAVASAPAGERR